MHDRAQEAREIIRSAERKAFAWGLLPVPLVDVAAVTVVQLGMIRRLAEVYGAPYRERDAKPILTALLGSLLPAQLGTTVARSMIRHVPGIGPLLGLVTLPASLGGATRIIGKLFAQHFENGGSVADFDLEVSTATRIDPPRPAPTPSPDATDELTRLDGIGPKICALLHRAGIRTFAQLADTPVEELERILQGAGSLFRLHDPASWPEQARLAAQGRWKELDERNAS